jgi:hypothetical protein
MVDGSRENNWTNIYIDGEELKIGIRTSEGCIPASSIGWTTTREMAPVYTMGNDNPRSFSRGSRGIAGSMKFRYEDALKIFGDRTFVCIARMESRTGTAGVYVMRELRGVEFLNAGSGVTKELFMREHAGQEEVTLTFIATEDVPWVPLEGKRKMIDLLPPKGRRGW